MKSAILVIDVQTVLFDPKPQPFESAVVLDKINTINDWARAVEFPVIFIQHERADSVIEFGSDGWKLQSELRTSPNDHFVRKTTPDSFLRTNLEDLLHELNIGHLFICGYASEFCVDTTTRRAAGLGYPVTLISDAHTTHDKPHATAEQIRVHHNMTLPEITSFGVKIKTQTVSSILAED
ncbi:cysteine hydrolase family protein [Gynuella sunshinyii]|uniref:Amidases-like nicotinamidase n=1 Tax=Gynuella sunshinyii YC6258 TaxID=1445510 RepID=A0A0C5VYV6_9GAMM|nr:cysteine hydrolase family protein [Gynuella sunshinyii]AJQ95599.1 amidases-like nicotinamidase [Gynuella sunshinyii YC6258]